MSYDKSKDLQIAISTGVNAAATITAGAQQGAEYFQEILPAVVGSILDVHRLFGNDLEATPPVTEEQAVANVQAAFPGSTVVQFPGIQPAAAPLVAAPAPVVPAPIPGAQQAPDTEQLWQSFFQAWNAGQVAQNYGQARVGQWFDNRLGKSSPSQPDFKVRGEKGERTAGLYKTGKGNPAWVAQALAQAGL